MATAKIITLKPRPAKLHCSACGATANAACDCGAPYVPAGEVAMLAVEARPDDSNRAIAADLGINEHTVRRARKSTATKVAVARLGKDGKRRKLPVRKKYQRLPDHRPPIAIEITAFHKRVANIEPLCAQIEAWHDANPQITSNTTTEYALMRASIVQILETMSMRLQMLAQKIDDR